MTSVRHRVQFPPDASEDDGQGDAVFWLEEPGGRVNIRFHDYGDIYRRPGLYEQLFYDRLKCRSPAKVAEILKRTVEGSDAWFSELRVLDFGAGNGIMGEEVQRRGVARLVGVDILPEARDAALRDRPEVYDAYYVLDFLNLKDRQREELASWGVNCLTCVAALGFGDIPPLAFLNALNLLQNGSWVAFNVKDTFLDVNDGSGFSRLIRELILSEYLNLYHLERYTHRLSIDGRPLHYYALVGRKTADIPVSFLSRIGL